ncbi:hypothetical protein AB7C87_24095 [Natrarchaeobius sp. A-rgal3]|uniref:hypothetical protein n=1 Tax=Natrarchaeobius versutus TaxID=1679078 RepID=UPI00350FACAD
MSSDRVVHADPSSEPPGENKSTGELTVEFIKKTWWIIAIAALALVSIVAMLIYGAPWRSIGIAVLILCLLGPFAVTYMFALVWYIDRETRRFALLTDENHEAIGLLDVAESFWHQIKIEEGSLGTRDSKAGKVYLASEFKYEQDAEIDPETGEEQTVAVPTLRATWEGGMDNYEFIEERDRHKAVMNRLVPLAKEAVKARAESDMRTLDNSIKQMHSIIAGAEHDEFIDLGADPWDWDTEIDHDPIDDVVREAEEDDEGPTEPLGRKEQTAQLQVGRSVPIGGMENGGIVSDD